MILSEDEILSRYRVVPAVYKITNLVNGKVYIGSTVNYRRRRSGHFSALRHNKHQNPYLQQAFNKHGEKNFTIEILTPATVDGLITTEQMFIDALNATDHDTGYNICAVAGKPNSLPKGKPRSEETRRRIGSARRGIKHTAEGRANISRGKKLLFASGYVIYNKGKKMSDAARLKMSIAHKGQVAWNRGVPISPEQRIAFCGASYKRPVLHLDRDGNLIAEYDSVKTARLATGKGQHIVTGKTPQKDGSRWEYKFK